MSAEDSTEQRLQLAGTNAGGVDNGQGKLASSASDKQRAVAFMEQHLLPDTQAACRMGEGGAAVQPPMAGPGAQSSLLKPDTGLTGLSAWAAHKGMSEALTTWQMQAGWLMNRLNRELNAVRSTNTFLQSQDSAIGAQIGSASIAQRPPHSRIDEW
ncbi:hypothetical protein EKH77_11830 [Streptomyces luteoverticillatus]|uniref:Uncharacterized protein n=1 Tax=Streptomyces luteoverticillatus TaxID=66425 RepID=A0A3S9PHH9_STRLT|nr:hypothetical protein [Streptomyces luteoverticillatus]AZQ71807.1 hypothetical protein EKH77_11830 [Streptomyces luteoverticillatus]